MTKRIFTFVLFSCLILSTISAQNAREHIRQGQQHMTNQNYAEAVVSFDAAAKLEPRNKQAAELLKDAKEKRTEQLFNQGQALHQEGKYTEAIENYRAAMRAAPPGYSKLRMIQTRISEAEVRLEEQREQELQMAEARREAAHAMARAAQEQAARELAEQSQHNVQKANEQFIAGEYDEAIRTYEHAVNLGGLTEAETADARRLIAEVNDIKQKIASYNRPLKDEDFDISQLGTSITITKYKASESKTIRIGNINHTIRYGIFNVVIPHTLYNIRVTKIDPNAFRDAGITNLTMPNSITEIGASAFSGNKLQSVTLSTELVKIDGGKSPGGILEPTEPGAFEGNEGLTSIRIPDKVTEIGARAFKNCGLTTVQIGISVATIRESAFMNNKLTVVTFPVGARNIYAIRRIHRNAFRENQITNLVLPQGIEVVYDNAFTDNPMESLSLPASLAGVITIDNQPNQPRIGGDHTLFTSPLPTFPNTITRVNLPAQMVDKNLEYFEKDPNLSGLRNLYITAQPAQAGQRALPARSAGLYIKNGPVWYRQQ